MFGTKITELRKNKGLTQNEMAKILGVARTTYSSYEQNRRVPDTEIQNKIADFYNVTLDYLHGREGVPSWADKNDIIDLEEMLNSNVNMAYGGEDLTSEQKQRVKDILTGIFWEKKAKKK